MNFKNRIIGTGNANPTDLIPNPKNWRKHPTQQQKALKQTLDKIGWIQDVIVNKTTGHLIDGHLRVETALKNKEKTIPVKYVELTEDEERVALATFDPIAALAVTDEEMLKTIQNAVEMDFDFSFFSDNPIKQEHTQEELEAVPEVPQTPMTKRGDVYQLGDHRLMCGDSTSADDVKKLMQSDNAKILFTSPPYSNIRDYEGGDMNVSNIVKFIPTFKPYTNYQVVNLGIQRKDNEIYQYWDEYIAEAKKIGYKLLAWNVWDKLNVGSIGQQSAMFPICHEWIFVFGSKFFEINCTEPKRDVKDIGSSKPVNVRQKDGSLLPQHHKYSSNPLKQMESINHILSEKSSIRSKHPAVFPVKLPIEYIKSMTNISDIVIEPFGGSGSTLIACEETGRKCRIMELAPKYCDVIISRWEKLTGKKAELLP